MKTRPHRTMPALFMAVLITTAAAQAPNAAKKKQPLDDGPIWWPYGAATTSEFCGVCHQAIYREHAFGFGADLSWKPMVLKSLDESPFSLPAEMPATATAHQAAGVDPWPIRAREYENGGQSCNVCHFPEAFNLPDI